MFEELLGVTELQLGLIVGAGLFGLVWHYLAKLVELREVNHACTPKTYFIEHWPESTAAVMATLVGVFGLLQLGVDNMFRVMFEAAIIGYTIDSHVNKWRSRDGLI